jgi:hypothetical protein
MLDKLTQFAAGCDANGFFGFPTWYKYLQHETLPGQETPFGSQTVCDVHFNSLSDIGPVLAAVIEILLRISALVAVGYVIYGGIKYITSQGEPDKLK